MTLPDAEKKQLTVDEVCRIIETSAKAKVGVLKFADLYLRFDKSVELPSYPVEMATPYTHIPATGIAEPNHREQNKSALAEMELQLREAQIEEMLITDPVRAEELIRDGELEEPDDESEDGLDDEA